MKSTFKKGWVGIIALLLAFLMALTLCLTACSNSDDDKCKDGHTYVNGICTECGAKDPDYSPEPEKSDITYKGQIIGTGEDDEPMDVYWFDASVQKPNSYTKIVGFKLTVKLTKFGIYGAREANCQCGIVQATKGAHEPNEYDFTYPDGMKPEFSLKGKTVTAFAVGPSSFLASMAFPGGINADLGNEVREGDTVTFIYDGETAVFAEGDPILTVVSFIGAFEYKKVEWVLGEPEEVEEQPWDRVETISYNDISTLPGGKTNENNYVDITIPDTNQESYPVVLWIHGGGYITGSRKSCLLTDTKAYMLAQGYAWVSAEYTLTATHKETVQWEGKDTDITVYDDGGMPQMLYDLKTAVRFLRANAATYKLNTDYIVAMGESAGAGLALLMATSNGETGELYEDLTMGWEDQSSDIQAAAGICPPTCFTGNLIDNMPAYIGSAYNEYYEAKKNNFAGYDEDKKAEIEEKAYAWSPSELITVDTVPLFMSFSKEDLTVPQEHYQAIKAAIDTFFTAEEAEEAGMVINNYEEGGHVAARPFDTYTAYTTLATWCNTQRDKALNK